MDLSSIFGKKWGILIEKESESHIFTGLKIPRDYYLERRIVEMFTIKLSEDEQKKKADISKLKVAKSARMGHRRYGVTVVK